MAEFQFNVDTRPMAESVDSARGHLNGVTLAVTAMEAAVIATERASAKTICENVDNGFYMLVKSQISQKAVAAYTEMTSKQVTLLQLAKALDNVKRQMESDYNMITRRYAKLFQSLNKALETRIKELDRSAMQLADIRKKKIFDKHKDDSSALFSISDEILLLAQALLSGRLKQKTRDAIRTLTDSIYENRSYSEKVDSILLKNENDHSGKMDLQYVPAIYSVAESLLNPDDTLDSVYTAQTDVWQNTAPVVSEIGRIFSSFSWAPLNDEEKALIRSEFIALCEKDSAAVSDAGEERVTKEMLRLFDESVWEDCKNGLQ
jgi:hypothetical protein